MKTWKFLKPNLFLESSASATESPFLISFRSMPYLFVKKNMKGLLWEGGLAIFSFFKKNLA